MREETDFKRLIGLDIWEGELTPLWFCVRHTEKGNVVYFLYQDENEYERRIDGYFADGKQYEKVGSIRCIPEMQCTLKYEVNGTEKNSGLDYFTCLTEDGRSVELLKIWMLKMEKFLLLIKKEIFMHGDSNYIKRIIMM